MGIKDNKKGNIGEDINDSMTNNIKDKRNTSTKLNSILRKTPSLMSTTSAKTLMTVLTKSTLITPKTTTIAIEID